MKTKTATFTPGPWKARSYKTDEGGIWIDCDAWKGKRALGGTLAEVLGTGGGEGSTEANARLIAEAPRMYKILEALAAMHLGKPDEVVDICSGLQGTAIALLQRIEDQAEYDGYHKRIEGKVQPSIEAR